MYDIYTTDMEFERCSKDKERINLIMPYSVLHFVLSGEGFVNGKKITENTVFISYKDTQMDYYPSRTSPWSYVYVRLMGRDIKKVFSDYDFTKGLTVLPFHKKKELFSLLSLYNSFCSYTNYDSARVIANAVLLLFEKEADIGDYVGIQNQNAEKVKRYIDENYHKKITVRSIAEEFFLSKDYIRNLFVRFYGVSPKAYIQSVRMERARELLCKTKKSITLIANSVGYDDSLLFSKMFKKYYSVSPSQYRSEVENDSSYAERHDKNKKQLL